MKEDETAPNCTAEELDNFFRSGVLERLGMGSRRACYKIPWMNFCVKCYRSDDEIKEGKYKGARELAPSVVREITKARFDEKRNTSCQEYRYWKKLKETLPPEVFAAFPQKMECVLVPARGWCLVEERLENFDGSEPEDFKSAYFAADDKIKKSLLSAFLRLIEQFRFYAVCFYDPQNLLVQRVSKDDFVLRIVDFEPASRCFIPFDSVLPSLVRMKTMRRARRWLKMQLGVEMPYVAEPLDRQDGISMPFSVSDNYSRRLAQNVRIKVISRGSTIGAADFEYRPGYVFVTDPSCSDYDWLVVYDEMPSTSIGTIKKGCEELQCPKECTLLATQEPVSIKRYSKAYTRQFGHYLSNRPKEAENHPHYHLGRGYYWWYIGRTYREYENLTIIKNKMVSVVSSSKKMRFTKHAARFNLAEYLTKSIPEMDWFGKGIRPFDKKYDVLEPYKYHVTIENHIAEHHWSEKLSDAFLAECLPFYAGDPAAGEVFPKESFIPIPIDDPKEAVDIIKTAIANGEYEKRRDAVLEAKRLILEKYNFYAQVIEVIEDSKDQPLTPVDVNHPVRIYGRKALRKKNLLVAIGDGLAHLKEDIKRLFN